MCDVSIERYKYRKIDKSSIQLPRIFLRKVQFDCFEKNGSYSLYCISSAIRWIYTNQWLVECLLIRFKQLTEEEILQLNVIFS